MLRTIPEGIKCPYCGCEEIGIDNWGMFEGDRDWFYYCKECDDTFIDDEQKPSRKEV